MAPTSTLRLGALLLPVLALACTATVNSGEDQGSTPICWNDQGCLSM